MGKNFQLLLSKFVDQTHNVAVQMPPSITDLSATHHTVSQYDDTTTQNGLGDSATNSMSAINACNKDDLSTGVVPKAQKNAQQKIANLKL